MLPAATEEFINGTMDKFGDELFRLSRKCWTIQMRCIQNLMKKAEKMRDKDTKAAEEQKRSEVQGEGSGGLSRNQTPEESYKQGGGPVERYTPQLRVAMDCPEPNEPQGGSSDSDWRATMGSMSK